MAECVAGGVLCCACCCAGPCAIAVKGGKLIISGVKHVIVRAPCPEGVACPKKDMDHLSHYSHPDDDDYGYAIRVHGGRGEFCTLRQCFNFMDAQQTGYVYETGALQELLRHVWEGQRIRARKGQKNEGCFQMVSDYFWPPVWKNVKKIKIIWKEMDTDGNGYVSFPEFVEWAIFKGRDLGLPEHVGLVGKKGGAMSHIKLKCTMPGCSCDAFECREIGDNDSERNNNRKGTAGLAMTVKAMFTSQANTVQFDDRFCATCEHKRGYHAARKEDVLVAMLPRSWAGLASVGRTESAGLWKAAIDAHKMTQCSQNLVAEVQHLVDVSVKRTWTRDRKDRPIPSAYQVLRVERNENVRMWLKYASKKALIAEAILDPRKQGNLPPLEPYTMMTNATSRSLPLLQPEDAALDSKLNEWFLWHGATEAAARGIARSEFKQLYAGSTTGTLYGAGTYLSDSCSKADEYAHEDDSGVAVMVLCRVMGGRVRYTADVTPDASKLVQDVLKGSYDCVLGDREKCRGTFKEIVVYESAQAFPEYLVYYKRIYPEEPPEGAAIPGRSTASRGSAAAPVRSAASR